MNRMYGSVTVGMNLDKKGHFTMGWSYGFMSSTDEVSTITEEFSLSEMGIKLGWFIDKEHTWMLTATYNFEFLVNAEFNDGTTTNEWRGSSYKIEFGFTPRLTENIFAGGKINYYTSSFGEEVINSSTLNQVSYTRGIIYPTLHFSYRFE